MLELILFLNDMTSCVVTVTVRVTVIFVFTVCCVYDVVLITDVSFERFGDV